MNILHYASIITCLIPALACAETQTLPIPSQSWAITFEAPPLRPVREAITHDHYMYAGNSKNFGVSLYVDTPSCQGGETHEAVAECAWSDLSTDSLINQASVSRRCDERFCMISYDLNNTFQNVPITQKHLHVLFAYRDRWTRFHVSISNPSEQEIQLLEKCVASLQYQ